MTIIAQRQEGRVLPDGTYLEADAKLHLLDGNARPYFSLTGTLWTSKRAAEGSRADRYMLTGGAIGDLIVEHMPGLAIINRLHLAADDGTPMHAKANGWYAYSGNWHEHDRTSEYSRPRTDTAHELAASILRISPEELPEGLDPDGFDAFVDSLAPRWAAEAAEARAVLDAS